MTKVASLAGIDVSKAFFDVCLLAAGQPQVKQFAYHSAGLQALADWLPQDCHCVLEATGPYHLRLAFFLHGQGRGVSVVNPLVIKRFSQMRLTRVKTDRADARLIAAYGLSEHPALWTPPAPCTLTLQQLEALGGQLQKQHTALTNQLEAFTASGLLQPQTRQFLTTLIRGLEKHQAQLEKKITALIMRYHSDLLQRLTSIAGLGKKTATVLIVLTEGFTKFATAKQLSAYVGLTPRIYESGSSVRGKARICKLGMSRIRALLYLCAWSAKRCNRACKALYDRLLAKGKVKKLALIAVAHKLLKQAFAIATQNTTYQATYQKKICL